MHGRPPQPTASRGCPAADCARSLQAGIDSQRMNSAAQHADIDQMSADSVLLPTGRDSYSDDRALPNLTANQCRLTTLHGQLTKNGCQWTSLRCKLTPSRCPST